MTTENQTEALTNWDEELAKQAAAAAEQEASAGGGNFFSLRGGQLTVNGSPLPGNQAAVIIIDSVIENVYYEGPFDPDDPQVPVCYALGRDEKTIAPHAEAEKPQAATCAECEWNRWGSLVVDGKQRRGKACRNRRRLALIPAGTLDPRTSAFAPFQTSQEITDAQLAYLALPPTSLAAYGMFVKKLAGALKLPPRAIFTKISLVADLKTQFKVQFSVLGQVPRELLGQVMTRAREVEAVIEFPYQKGGRTEAAAPPAEASDGKDKGKGKRAKF